MKTIFTLLIVLAGSAFAGDALQDLANITAINALNNRKKSEPVTVVVESAKPSANSGILAAALKERTAQYNELVARYNSLLAEMEAIEAENAKLKSAAK